MSGGGADGRDASGGGASAVLAEVRLERYGALAGVGVALGPGVTVVVGLNEAGKSTFLSGLGDLLWGLPPRAALYALTPRSAVRLAATLDDGAHVVRTNQGLLGADGLSAATSPWGGDERASWLEGFGLDHAGLRAGGQAVFTGRGDLAALVFTARSGQGAGAVLDALEARADALYRRHRGATTVAVRTARARLEAVRAEVAAASTRASLVTAAEQDVAAAGSALVGAEAAEAAADREHRRRQREAAALPDASALRAVRTDLAGDLARGQVLEPTALDAREQADARAAAVDAERAALERDVARWRADVGGLRTEPDLLADAAGVGALHAQAQAREADAVRAGELAATAAGHTVRALAAADELSGPARLPADLGAQVEAAAAQHADLARAAVEAASRTAAAQDALRPLEAAGDLPDPAALAPLDARARALGGEDAPVRRWREAVAAAEVAATACEGHLREAGALDVPGALAAARERPQEGAPGAEACAAAAAALGDAETARTEAARDADRAAARVRGARAALDGLDVPAVDAATVVGLRAERERRWEALVGADGLLDLGERTAYQGAVRAADQGADALAEAAQALAQREGARHEVDDAEDERQRADAALSERGQQHGAATASHAGLWRGTGAEVPSPARAEAVRRSLVAAALAAGQARQHDAAAGRAAQEVAAGVHDLSGLLVAAGASAPAGDDVPALEAALASVTALVRAADEAREARADRARAVVDRDAARAAGERAASALAAWQQGWEALLGAADLPRALDALGWAARRQVAATAQEAGERAEQVAAEAGLARAAWETFADAVAGAARRHGDAGTEAVTAGTGTTDGAADGDRAATLATLDRLWGRLGAARADAATLTEREDQLAGAAHRLVEVGEERARADADAARALDGMDTEGLDAGGTGAGGGDPAGDDPRGVGVLLARSRAVAALRAREADLLDRLAARTAPGGEGVEELVAALDGVDEASAEQRLAEAGRREGESEAQRSAAAEELGSARARLQALTRGSRAAELRTREAQALADLAEVTERYALAHLQRTLLREQLEAHAARHASPLLETAGHALEALTGGRWVALVATEASAAERSLRVVDAAGGRHEPGQLSEGTADQVFLALRLAGIAQVAAERAAQGRPALPVVLDDALMTFDDVRAGAALRLLAESGQQVVVLTHHDHLGALATSLGHPRVSVAHLPAPSAGADAAAAGAVRSAATRERAPG